MRAGFETSFFEPSYLRRDTTSVTDAASNISHHAGAYPERSRGNADNNLTSKTDRKGQTITYLYDALNRLAQKSYPDSTSVEYAYDLVGKILQVNDPTGAYAFAYDNLGRLIGTTTSYAFLPGALTNAYSYDAASNRTGFTAPDGSANT